MKIRAALFAVSMALTAATGCAAPAGDSSTKEAEGLTIVSSDVNNGVIARWVAGTTVLEFHSKIVGDKAVGEVVDSSGTRLTTVSFPVGTQPPALRPLVEQGAADSLSGLQDLSTDKTRIATTVIAYRAASSAIASALPKDLPTGMVSVLEAQASVLAFGLLQLNPRALAALDAKGPDGKTGYVALTDGTVSDDGSSSTTTSTSSTPAPNDDSADQASEPTTWVEYDEYGNIVGGTTPYYLMIYSSGNSCDGACGPGCSWCYGLGGGHYMCETNSFCQWHDTHCGAWLHFFSCH